MTARWLIAVATVGLAAAAEPGLRAAQVDASKGCNLYQSGVTFMQEGKDSDALNDFQIVLSTCGQVNIKAQALVQSGRIYLRTWPRKFGDARKVAGIITSQYVDTPSAPDGFILLGLIELEENRNFDAALNQFRRVREIAPSSNSVAEAQYRSAEVLRIAHQFEDALRRFEDVTLKYPTTIWSARALIGAANCNVRLGQVIPAMEGLQRVRRDFPGSPEAALALQRNTILHRLTMRGSQQTPQLVRTVGTGKYRDGAGLVLEVLEGGERVILGYRDGIALISTETGQQIQAARLGAADVPATAVGLAPGGIVALARERFLSLANGAPDFWPGIPQRDGTTGAVEVEAFVTNWKGDWLIADGKTDAIHRFAGNTYLSVFASNVQARRIVQNEIDDVAVVNDRTKGVSVYGRDGGAPREIPRRVASVYEWDSPADIAFDALGNLYVLDGGRASIHAFDSALKFRTTLQLPAKGATSIRKAFALTVDGAGRIYVLDRDGQQVLAFQ